MKETAEVIDIKENDMEKFAERHPDMNETLPAVQSRVDVIAMAVSKNMSIEQLQQIEKMMDLEDRYDAKMAKKAFLEAKANFNRIKPALKKDKFNKYFESKYTSLGNLLATYGPSMGDCGLSIDFPSPVQGDKTMEVFCRLSHANGHGETISLKAPIDQAAVGKQSGKRSRNAIQDIKSTFTYLRSATAEAVLGVTGTDASLDDDGNGAGRKVDEFIDEHQAKTIVDLIFNLDLDDKQRDKYSDDLLEYYKIDTFDELPVGSYKEIVSTLKAAKGGEK